jgi:hypothetical protein
MGYARRASAQAVVRSVGAVESRGKVVRELIGSIPLARYRRRDSLFRECSLHARGQRDGSERIRKPLKHNDLRAELVAIEFSNVSH